MLQNQKPLMKNIDLSKVALLFCFAAIILTTFIYPKWNEEKSHAPISWDVSGYYIYLPAIFIYQDIKKVAFKNDIHNKYRNSSHAYETRTIENGNEVAKYSMGQAVMYSPFFFIAHSLAGPLGYEKDGYTLPYQAAVYFGSIFVAFIGLYFARKNLLEYFDQNVTAATLIILTLGTNYLNYVTSSSCMSHNYLFTLTSILIWTTIKFYKKPSYSKALLIGGIIGLAALTRPTEILLAFIPLFWGMKKLNGEHKIFKDFSLRIKERFAFLATQKSKLILAILLCGLIGSLQLMYWKYVSGNWIVFSYEDDQGFDWFHPHIKQGLISFKKGWLVYTPIMFFSLLGMGMAFYKRKPLGLFLFMYFPIVLYYTFAWKCWWYGGSAGQRALVQSYAVLILPLAYFITWLMKENKRTYVFTLISFLFIYYNIWLYHQAQKGGMLDPENMTKEYFWKIVGRWERDPLDLKLLDTSEEFRKERKNVDRIYFNDFESDTIIASCAGMPIIKGNNSYCVPKIKDWERTAFYKKINNLAGKWIRVGAIFKLSKHEWDVWKMPQLIVRLKSDGNVIKSKMIRISRLQNVGYKGDIYIDVNIPDKNIDEMDILFWNESSKAKMMVDDLYIELFE